VERIPLQLDEELGLPYWTGALGATFDGIEKDVQRLRKEMPTLQTKDPLYIKGRVKALLDTLDRAVKSGRKNLKSIKQGKYK